MSGRRIVDSRGPVPSVVGTAGEVDDGPMATGRRLSPASSQENRADHPAGAAIPPLLSSTGGGDGSEFQPVSAPRLPRGYSTRFCVTGCNARGRVHINGECVVCRDFGGDR